MICMLIIRQDLKTGNRKKKKERKDEDKFSFFPLGKKIKMVLLVLKPEQRFTRAS